MYHSVQQRSGACIYGLARNVLVNQHFSRLPVRGIRDGWLEFFCSNMGALAATTHSTRSCPLARPAGPTHARSLSRLHAQSGALLLAARTSPPRARPPSAFPLHVTHNVLRTRGRVRGPVSSRQRTPGNCVWLYFERKDAVSVWWSRLGRLSGWCRCSLFVTR